MFLAVIKSSTDISFINCRLVIELFNGEIVILFFAYVKMNDLLILLIVKLQIPFDNVSDVLL